LRAAEVLSERTMLRLVTEQLEESAGASESADDGMAALLARLTRAVRRLLEQNGRRAQAYSVALLLDASQAKTTFYLQRELASLLEARGPSDFMHVSGCGLANDRIPPGRRSPSHAPTSERMEDPS